MTKKVLYSRILPPSARGVAEDLAGHFPNVSIEINSEDKIYILRMNEQEKYHIRVAKFDYEAASFGEIPDGWSKVLFAGENADIRAMTEYVKDKKSGGIEFSSWRTTGYSDMEFVESSDMFFEILPFGCNKGTALKKLCELKKLEGFKIAAMGDYDNDLPMMEYADISAAPAGANENVKPKADLVTKASCEDGAVAEFISYIESA